MKMISFACLLLSFVLFRETVGYQCLSCNSAVKFSDCLENTIACSGADQQCFLEVTMQDDWTTRISAGCRTKAVCDALAAFGKRSVGNSLTRASRIMCSECCASGVSATGIPCNGFLCNEQPTGMPSVTTSSNVNIADCAICDQIANYSQCAVTQQCPSNEACIIKAKILGGSVVYELGCEQKTQCDSFLKLYLQTHSRRHTGRDQGVISICAACCVGRNCNKDNCFELRKKQPCFDQSICGSP